jgi:hypothetical protein
MRFKANSLEWISHSETAKSDVMIFQLVRAVVKSLKSVKQKGGEINAEKT